MNKCIEDGVRPSQEIKDRLLALSKQKMVKIIKLYILIIDYWKSM